MLVILNLVSKKISIELTSDRKDGFWTWRATGAKEPKGIINSDMLPDDSGLNSVLKVEIESGVDGIRVVSVVPPVATPNENTGDKYEILELKNPKGFKSGVTTKYSGKPSGKDRSRRSRGQDSSGGRDDWGRGRGQPSGEDKRLQPSTTHRKAWLDSLPEAEAEVGKRVARGGMRAIREALQDASAGNSGAGETATPSSPFIELAERLWLEYRTAEWQDRIDAAAKSFAELPLSEIRAVVASDYPASPEYLGKAAELKQKLLERQETEHTAWLKNLEKQLDEGNITRALRMSGHPPRVGVPLPRELAKRLVDSTQEVLSAADSAQKDSVRQAKSLIDALTVSPVRRLISPPDKLIVEVAEKAEQLKDRLPGFATQNIEKTQDVEPQADQRATNQRDAKQTGADPGAVKSMNQSAGEFPETE